jgi:hypothetical protein
MSRLYSKSNLSLLKVVGDFRLFALLTIFTTLLVASASPWPDDQDGVNFLLGVERYDLKFHQPHFPGYPVYIVAGKLLRSVINSPEWALVALSVISGVSCVWLMFVWVSKFQSRDTALFCATALAVNPVFFEFSHKIFTEIPAMALLLMALVILGNPVDGSGKRWFASGAIMGMMLGIRLSWWPYPLFYLLYGAKTGRGLNVLGGLVVGVLLWLAPQATLVGASELATTGLSFTGGHFSDWGGAIGAEMAKDPRLISLILRIGEAVGWIGSGTIWTRVPWAAFTFVSIVIFLGIRNDKKEANTFLLATLFYLLWVALGQNLEKTRHLIMIAPAVIVIAAPLIEKYKKAAAIAIVALGLTLPVDYLGRRVNQPPALGLAQWIELSKEPYAEYYCGESERFFDLYPSKKRVVNVRSVEKLDDAIKASWPKPAIRYICDDIAGLSLSGEPVAVFPARIGDPIDRTLSIYRR